jgi:hypothetical protein
MDKDVASALFFKRMLAKESGRVAAWIIILRK